MKHSTIRNTCIAAFATFVSLAPAWAQITSNEGDGVLNAPYRGTIDSLRECSEGVSYGEVQSHVEPTSSGVSITSGTIDIWVEGTWDRSVLRMYEGLDASNSEIDLTGTSESSPATVSTDAGGVKRLSYKAIGTKTLAPQAFAIHMSYTLSGSQSTPTRTVTVAPMTGSFCALPGERDVFLLGTPILDVAVGNARLTVPVGRTAEMIGSVFIENNDSLGPTTIDTNDVLFPGAAESVHIQNNDQFRLSSSQAAKTEWGTPWPGHLVGYRILNELFGPDGTRYDSGAHPSDAFRRIDIIRPSPQSTLIPSWVEYSYDDSVNNRVTAICDKATTQNCITLTRDATGDVMRITTSDGRGWDIDSDPDDGWITAIIPDSGNGKRSFTYNLAGRVTQVRDVDDALMYEFTYDNDAGGNPTILTEERRVVDGTIKTVIQHEIVSESLRRRKEFTGPNEFRQFDLAYDAPSLNHRLASITSYGELNTTGAPFIGGTGTPFTTTFTHDVNNPNGSMVITQVVLPDGSTINHEYDAHVDSQSVDFGFRTKSTRTGPNDGSLVTFDVDYEFFYTSGSTRLFFRPRIVKQRDGRGGISEITFDYDNGGKPIDPYWEVEGQDLNRLLSITGPTINTPTPGLRTPETRFEYDDDSDPTLFVLQRRETDFASGMLRSVDFAYDELLRVTSQTIDVGSLDIKTQFLFCDTAATQDRITVDANGFWTRTRFDNDGRVTTTERFLDVNAGIVGTPCVDPTGFFYRTTNTYDTNGRLVSQVVENKDQDGNSLIPATIETTFSYDRLGRLELQTVDPGGIGQESNFDYNWLGEVEREFDTTGRGTSRLYDGRGLVTSETPLAFGEQPDANLTTSFQYDAMANLRFTSLPTLPAGAKEERVYDDFDRLKQIQRIAGSDGGSTITTTFEYDNANNVTRTVVDENAAELSDTTALYDEGGFNYETRQRMVAGADDADPGGANDPITQRKFDWAGNITEELSPGDATVADRVITTVYDAAERVESMADSEGGETTFVRDKRGNVTQQTVKIDATDAITTTVYDALSRTIQVTEPEDGANARADRDRRYDSRGNLLRERIRDAADAPKVATVFAYDHAGRQTRRALLANAAATTDAAGADVTTDRVTDFIYDADGRLQIRRTYNNNSATPLDTVTTYDSLGHTDRVTDPSLSFTDDDYATNGRLSLRAVFDGLGTRSFTFGYDGHDRITQQTAIGSPNLVTAFQLDGLDRRTRITDAKGIATRTDFDLVGRRTRLVEDDIGTGALERQTDFGYNRLSQLITQTAKNKTAGGGDLLDQLTTYRYDSLGRQTRAVYPDNMSADHDNPTGCTDCVQTVFDLAGRMTQRTDQRGLTTDFIYDDRGLLLTRTTDTDLDTFGYDGVGRMTLAERGTTVGPDPDAVSSAVRIYTDLGDLDFETQTIADGTARTVDYGHDQAGNRIQLTYPGGDVLAYAQTALNQVDTVNLNAIPFLDYGYSGRLLDKRRTITNDPGGNTAYEYEVGYDSHRRVNTITNRLEPAGGGSQTVVAYGFSHDDNGNPLTQTAVAGMPAFVADDRAFTVDRLNRLTGTEYFENSQFESTTFDLVGNRESHTNRAGTVTGYGIANPANEYPSIGGATVLYDEAGNLTVDQDGRQYTYDEQNRLIQIRALDGTTELANYTYDALGRRILFENPDPITPVTTRYYYDGQSVIEERDAADVRLRFHVNGAQFIDERVTTFEESTSEFTYYLLNQNFSIAGMGNADGSTIERLDYTSTGDFAGGGSAAEKFFHDADDDLDIDLRDFINFQNCFDQTDTTCQNVHDFGTTGGSDGNIDLDDYARSFQCLRGPFVIPDELCTTTLRSGALPAPGTFGMHGRAYDVLSDDSVLQDFRARTYLPVLGRWLQRDPRPYNDGSNLYEPFRGNALRDTDPSGEGVLTWLLVGDYGLSDAQFLRDNGFRTVTTPTFGFFEGAGTASVNIVVGAGENLKQLGLQVADTVVIFHDIHAMQAGFPPLDFDPLSQLGQVSATTDDTLGLQLRVGGRAGANIVTLGAFNVVEGTIAFAQTGDAEALSRNVGGQGLIILGTAGIARVPSLLRARSGAPNSAVRTSASQVGRSVRFDPKALRFRDIASGRFVPTSEVLQTTTFSRIVSTGELQAILESNTIQSLSGRTFFTINPSLRATRVQLRLGLEGPLRVFRVDFRVLNRPNVVGPQRVQAVPNVPGSGGGIEFFTTDPLSVQLTRVRALRRSP